MLSFSPVQTGAYIQQLQRFYHGRLIKSGGAHGRRGQPLLPLGRAPRAVPRLQEGALQLADVGLVSDHLSGGRGVLQ